MFDVHTHAFPKNLAPKAASSLEKFFKGLKAKYIPSYPNLRKLLKRYNFKGAFVQNVATNPEQVKKLNDLAHRMNSLQERHRGTGVKLIFSGTFHGEFENYLSEIERMKNMKIYFIKFQPEFQKFDPLSDEFLKIVERAGRRFFLLFHCGFEYSNPDGEPSVTPEKLARLKELVPEAIIVAAHMGGALMWEDVLEHIAGRDIWIDTSGSVGLIPPELAKEIFKEHRKDRILFGTDYPFFSFQDTIKFVQDVSGYPLEMFAKENVERLMAQLNI